MSSKYGDIMDKVEVSDEMRRRIVGNIGNYDFKRGTLLMSIAKRRRYVALAACLVLVLFAAIAIPKFMAPASAINSCARGSTFFLNLITQ